MFEMCFKKNVNLDVEFSSLYIIQLSIIMDRCHSDGIFNKKYGESHDK